MELAHRAGLKVLLDGQGGDETLAGYFRYLPIRMRDLLARGRLRGVLATARTRCPTRLGLTTTLALTARAVAAAPLVGRCCAASFGQGKDRVLGRALRGALPRRVAALRGRRASSGSGLANQLAFDTLAAPAALAAALRGSQQHGVLDRDAAAVPRLPAGRARVLAARRPASSTA